MSGAGLLLWCGIMLLPSNASAQGGSVLLEADVDGRPVGVGTLLLDPDKTAKISVTVRNNTSTPQRVKTVRISGTALALTFFAYDTTVPFDVPAKSSETRSFPLEPTDLGSQAIGLLPVTVEVIDPQRETIASIETTADVRGSLWSVYGAFGLGVLVLTALSWAGALIALARRRLPANRWQRAMRFLPAGIGTGLIAVITLSVLRLVAPSPSAEIPFIVGAAAVALILGYVTPHPGERQPSEVETVRIFR
jgi:branched-subunit amino acid transport protein